MPKVEITVSSLQNISFEVKKTFTYEDDDWEEMTPDEREALVKEDGEAFMRDTVEWDYEVLP